MSKIFYTPSGYTGNAELSASTGLTIVSQGRWLFSQQGYNDQATFGVSISWPYGGSYYNGGPNTPDPNFSVNSGPPPTVYGEPSGLLHLTATNWNIAVIGNTLTDYTDPDTHVTYPASQCRITVVGCWNVIRKVNSNAWNGFVVNHSGKTETDQGDRDMSPWLLDYTSQNATYIIQGADVTGGAMDTFSTHEFWSKITETASSNNSNHEFQTNTVARPVWAYTYTKSWEITV